MLLVGVREENSWLISRWNLTYRVGWDSICKAVHSAYDFYRQAEILTDNKLIDVADKEEILSLDESRWLTIRGLSAIVGVPLMITFYNQSDAVDVNVAMATEEFSSADYEKFNKSLNQYLSSMEIAMYG